MDTKASGLFIKVLVVFTFLFMFVVNSLASILPINNQNTGAISDSYENLFAPAGITFSIWGLIYLLLGIYTVYQMDFYKLNVGTSKETLMKKVGILFSVSSVANGAWIFSWHYEIIPLSLIFMLVILVCLIIINKEIKKVELNDRDLLFIGLPFSVYFAWITVAAIANVTIFLVSIQWNGFGIEEPVWTIIILIVGAAIGVTTMFVGKDIPYGLVLIWAYVGIFIKHTDANYYAGAYQGIINTVGICIGIFVAAEAYTIFTKKDKIFSRISKE